MQLREYGQQGGLREHRAAQPPPPARDGQRLRAGGPGSGDADTAVGGATPVLAACCLELKEQPAACGGQDKESALALNKPGALKDQSLLVNRARGQPKEPRERTLESMFREEVYEDDYEDGNDDDYAHEPVQR